MLNRGLGLVIDLTPLRREVQTGYFKPKKEKALAVAATENELNVLCIKQPA